MKKTYTLTKAEVEKAVQLYVRSLGENPVGKVIFQVGTNYDYYDRPIGNVLESATVECEVTNKD